MKKSLSILALLLAVVMIALCCAACGSEPQNDIPSDDQQSPTAVETSAPTAAPSAAPAVGEIVGRWRYTIEFSALIAASKDQIESQVEDNMKTFYEAYFEAFSGAGFDLIMEYDADGSYSGSIDEATVRSAIDLIRANLLDSIPAMVASIGMSMEDFESNLSQQGYTIETYVDMMIEQMNFTNSLQLDSHGRYRLDGNRLYTSDGTDTLSTDSYGVVEFDADTMTITEVVGESSEAFAMFGSVLLPMTFYRVG